MEFSCRAPLAHKHRFATKSSVKENLFVCKKNGKVENPLELKSKIETYITTDSIRPLKKEDTKSLYFMDMDFSSFTEFETVGEIDIY